MAKGMDLARAAFADMKAGGGTGEEGGGAPKPTTDAKSVAGRRFAEAVKSGDGAAVAAAFETLQRECSGAGYSGGEE